MEAAAGTPSPTATADTFVLRASGPDQPGITAELMALLGRAGAEVQDIQQVLVRSRLTLAVVVRVDGGRDLLKELLLFAWDHDLRIEFDLVEPVPRASGDVHIVTVLGRELGGPIGAAQIALLATAIGDAGGNIDRIARLSRYPVWSYELRVEGTQGDALRRALAPASAAAGLDVAVQPEGLGRRAKRLVVMDVDSTLIQNEVIDLLADEAGCLEQVAELTEAAMRGELDFEAALRERVRLLKGLDLAAVARARDRVTLTPGARTFVRTLRRLGYKVGIVSGGFTLFTDHLAVELGLDHAVANKLEVVDGRLTGEVVGPVVDRRRKADLLELIATREGIPLEQTVAIGDGANDLDMLAKAGLGVAFNAKPLVAQAADTAVNVPYLDAVLFILGVSRDEVEADAGVAAD